MEQIILMTMPPDAIPRQVSILGKVLGKTDAASAGALLCGAIANMIGNIPDKLWDEMLQVKISPCPEENCTCHLTQMEFIQHLIPVRELFKKAVAEHKGEEGFSA